MQVGVRARHIAPNPLQPFLASKPDKVAQVNCLEGSVMLYLELQCHSLNRSAAAKHKTVFKSLSCMGAEEIALAIWIWSSTFFCLAWWEGREWCAWYLTTVFWMKRFLKQQPPVLCHWLTDSWQGLCGEERGCNGQLLGKRNYKGGGRPFLGTCGCSVGLSHSDHSLAPCFPLHSQQVTAHLLSIMLLLGRLWFIHLKFRNSTELS